MTALEQRVCELTRDIERTERSLALLVDRLGIHESAPQDHLLGWAVVE
ncbi:hypothetical protein AB0D66_30870 [Streptomyces sp. NPDC048270]